jgi:ankyrin repeat protein
MVKPDHEDELIVLVAATRNLAILTRELDAGLYINTQDFEHQRTLLQWAILGRRQDVVQLLISRGADVNSAEPIHGRSALHMAVTISDAKIAESLLEAGAHIDSRDNQGETPLLLACRAGNNNKLLALLLNAGADPDVKSHSSKFFTPLTVAARLGHVKAVKLLLLHNATAHLVDGYAMTPLMYAVREDHGEIANLLSKRMARDDPRSSGDIWEDAMSSLRTEENDPYQDLDQETGLLRAARDGRLDIVKSRLEAGISVGTKDEKSQTPLSLAAENGYDEVASVLLEWKADPNTQDAELQTPLMHAASHGHADIMSLLLDNGADVDCRDANQWTALMVASEQGHEACVRLLLEHGADSNAEDEEQFTPLLHAAISGHQSIVAELIDAGADVDAQDEAENLTAISRAAEGGHEDVLRILVENNADPNADNRTLHSTLYGFSSDNDRAHSVIQMLVDHGADVYMDCWTDERPLVIASKQGRIATVKLFLEAKFDSAKVRREHIWDAITVAAEHGEKEILAMLMNNYAPDGTESETPWEWVKSYRFGQSYELLRPYFESENTPES